MRNLTILVALAVGVACKPAPKPDAGTETSSIASETAAAPAALSAKDEAAVRAVDAEWARAVTAGDAAALNAVYSSDATLLPPNEPVVKGDAVKKYNEGMLGAFTGPTVLTTQTVEGRGDLAYAVGTYRATLTPKKAGAKPLPEETGKYVEVLKKDADGSWKIVYDMWSSDNAPGKH